MAAFFHALEHAVSHSDQTLTLHDEGLIRSLSENASFVAEISRELMLARLEVSAPPPRPPHSTVPLV
jgi:hypothetical protein